jgi:hypothetical protein
MLRRRLALLARRGWGALFLFEKGQDVALLLLLRCSLGAVGGRIIDGHFVVGRWRRRERGIGVGHVGCGGCCVVVVVVVVVANDEARLGTYEVISPSLAPSDGNGLIRSLWLLFLGKDVSSNAIVLVKTGKSPNCVCTKGYFWGRKKLFHS